MALRLGLVLMAVALAAATGVAGCASPPQSLAQADMSASSSPGRWLGSGSCAAMGCHNSNGFRGDKGSEYTTWVSHDPHARAYEVLFNDRSRTIAANLGAKKRAHENSLCLNCHVHKDYEKEQADHHPRFAKEDGVGCESCHGAARDWVSEHHKAAWHEKTEDQKLKLGMQDTRSLVGRVRSCTPCHVGSEGMDVNHDLIAAGHPRLAFDFNAYHALMPHHWQQDNDKPRPDWDAAAWFVGEVLTAQAGMELLASRAKNGPWPEFAEYDCYACHHQLQSKTWRQSKERFDGNKRKLGSLPWSDWYVGPQTYLLHPGNGNSAEAAQLLQLLRTELEEKAPARATICAQAEKAAAVFQGLARHFDGMHYAPEEAGVVFRELVKRGANQEARSWDKAARNYLALVALYQTWPDAKTKAPDRKAIHGALTGIRKALQFDDSSDSPRTTYTPQTVLEPYRDLQSRLGPAPR